MWATGIRSIFLSVIIAMICMSRVSFVERHPFVQAGKGESSINRIEICDNAVDDDDDGLIDLNDPDCTCAVIEPESLIPNPSFEDMNCCPNAPSKLIGINLSLKYMLFINMYCFDY